MFYIDICLITVNRAKARYRSYFYEIPLWCSLFNISSESSNLKQESTNPPVYIRFVTV